MSREYPCLPLRPRQGSDPGLLPSQAGLLHPLDGRRFVVSSTVVAALVAATRWPLRGHYLFSWDAANFAQALDAYNVAFHRPHPPGYPLYVAAAWLLRTATSDTNTAYIVLSLVASIAASVLLLGFAWRLYGAHVASLSTGLFVFSPNTWGHGEVAYPYAFLAAGAMAVAWCGPESLHHIRSIEHLLGPDTRATNRRDLVVPDGVKTVIVADLDVNSADRSTGLQRVNLGRGTSVYTGRVDTGESVRVGYSFARILSTGAQAQRNPPAGP